MSTRLPIRAEITGLTRAAAAGLNVTGHSPVLKLCRALIQAGHDPATPLEAYRGATLSIRMRSIGEAAALTVRETTRDGRPRFVKLGALADWDTYQSSEAGPPAWGNGLPLAGPHAQPQEAV
jgi:hypothetical protein